MPLAQHTKNALQTTTHQVSSDRCHYCGMSGKELVKHHEDANHFGGYFIINGNEKVMRMLQVRWLIGILVKTGWISLIIVC